MIRDFTVDELYEGHFDGVLLKEIVAMLQNAIDKYGEESTLNLYYDYDDCIAFKIMSPREETQTEEYVRVQLEVLEQRNKEIYERTLYAELKGKYGEE